MNQLLEEEELMASELETMVTSEQLMEEGESIDQLEQEMKQVLGEEA